MSNLIFKLKQWRIGRLILVNYDYIGDLLRIQIDSIANSDDSYKRVIWRLWWRI